MSSIKFSNAKACCFCIALIALPASATVVNSIPGGTIVSMPAINYFGSGPQSFGPGITWSSTNTQSVFGYTNFYGFGGEPLNGNWTGALGPMAGLNSSTDDDGTTDTMTFAFSTPLSAVGGFFNHVESFPLFPLTVIAVYDSNMNLIESTSLDFMLSGTNDKGIFFGFQQSTPHISYFTMTDNYVGITKLTISPIPEPETYAMLLVGLGLISFLARRKKK